MTAPEREQKGEAYSGLPLLIYAFIAVLVALSVAGVALLDRRLEGPSPFEAVAMVVVLALSSYLLLRVRIREHVLTVDTFEAALTPAVFAFAGPWAVILGVCGVAIAEIVRRNAFVKGMFNVATFGAATVIGSAVYLALGGGASVDVKSTSALAAAMLCVGIVNAATMSVVLHLATATPLRATIRDSSPALAINIGANVPFGFIFAAAFATSPAVIPFFLVPLVLLHLASRGYSIEQVDRARLEGLQRATHALGEPVDPRQAVGRFLNEVRQSFEAEVVDLVIHEDGMWMRYRVAGGKPGRTEFGPIQQPSLAVAASQLEHADRITHASSDVTLGRLLRSEGWRDCIAAPVRIKDEVIGTLCAYNRGGIEGFEHGELAVMDALAAEAASAVQRGELVDAILEERRKLSEIVESTSDGIFTLAADGIIRTWNAAMANLTGYGAELMLGTQSVGLLRPRDEQDTDVLLERWAEVDALLPARVQVRTKQGASRWLDCSYTTSDGEERLLIVVARDITQVHEVDRLKADFVSIVSHELRTPIAPIKGFASTLLQAESDQMDDATRRLALESILRQAQRLESLIMNLLEVSKIERGPRTSEVVPVDVVTSCRRVIDELRPAWPKRTIELEAGEGIVGIGRELWVDQIVTNLLSNALKYAPDDAPVTLRVEAVDDAVRVSVIDRGPGVPEHERSRIFERFERLHRHDMQAGTGLGLYISRHLAEAMGGTLSLDSVVGEGSTFTLELNTARRPRLVALG